MSPFNVTLLTLFGLLAMRAHAFPRAQRRDSPLRKYCLQNRGQFPYPPDCHKFVNCGESGIYLETCSPPYLVFDPTTASNPRCNWPGEPWLRDACNSTTTTTTTATKTTTALPFSDQNSRAPKQLDLPTAAPLLQSTTPAINQGI